MQCKLSGRLNVASEHVPNTLASTGIHLEPAFKLLQCHFFRRRQARRDVRY